MRDPLWVLKGVLEPGGEARRYPTEAGALQISLYRCSSRLGLAIGRFILPKRWHDGSRGYYLLAMTLGVLFVGIVKMIPVPWVAGIVGLIVTIWGAGRSAHAVFQRDYTAAVADRISIVFVYCQC